MNFRTDKPLERRVRGARRRRSRFDAELGPNHEINQAAARSHGLTYDRGKRAFVDDEGCPVRDKYGQPVD